MSSNVRDKDTTVRGTVSRGDRATARSTLEKVVQLEQRVVSLERERSSQLYSRRHEFRKVFCSLEETEAKFSRERKAEKQELSLQIARIRGSVQSFKKMLEEMKPGPTFMERLKQVLEETEASILSLKNKQREVDGVKSTETRWDGVNHNSNMVKLEFLYEGLLVEERQVSQEVMAFQRRLDSWTTSVTTTTSSSRPSEATGPSTVSSGGGGGGGGEEGRSLPPAVLAFERFLRQTGGVRGGWDDYDHNTFRQLRNKHSNEAVFMDAALHELPTRSESEVRAHSAWYTEYCTLLEAKRVSIQQWKKHKQIARLQQLKEGTVKKKDTEMKAVAGDAERQRVEKENQIKRERLQTWKTEQEQRRREAEELRQMEEKTKARKQEKDIIRQAIVKEQVRQYQEEKERERQIMEDQKKLVQERELQLQAKREIGKFQERDMRVMSEKRERDRQREMEKVEQETRLNRLKQQVSVNVSRDPERIYQLTSGWRERNRARKREEKEGCGVNNIGSSVGVGARDMPRRAVSAWRQGV